MILRKGVLKLKAKKIVSILLAALLLALTCAVTVMGYDKSFFKGYSHSVKYSKNYVKMEYLHNTAVHAVNTFANNLTDAQIKTNVAAQTRGKTTNNTKDETIDAKYINNGAKAGVSASYWRSTSTNVYYVHAIDVFGNTNTTYIVSSVIKTVG